MSAHDYLCKALDLAEKTTELFEKAAASCGDDLGQEVFSHLLEDGRSQTELVRDVKEKIEAGGEWAESCTLHELDEIDIAAAFKVLAAEHVTPGTCTTQLGAVRAAKDMLSTSITFYSEWMKQATDETEKSFIAAMQGELRTHILTLADLEYYYEDPEGWALMQDNPVLDGA